MRAAGGKQQCMQRGLSVRVQAAKSFTDHTSKASTSLSVEVFEDTAAVAAALCKVVESAAQESIAARGAFALAVPGGSVLKMMAGLSSSKKVDWTKTHLFFVNHKAVAMDDDLATCKKAKALFLDSVGAPAANVYALGGTPDAAKEAATYEARLRKAMADKLVVESNGLPVFDLMLLGMGSDGHVGSLYPNRPEISITDKLVAPVVKGEGPASITLSLPVMNAAAHSVIAMTGEKKAPAVKKALEEKVAPGAFPAQQVKPRTMVWLLDTGAASALRAVSGVAALGV